MADKSIKVRGTRTNGARFFFVDQDVLDFLQGKLNEAPRDEIRVTLMTNPRQPRLLVK